MALVDVGIAPLGHDSGSSLKIPDDLAHGKTVLCTEHGVRGFSGIDPFVELASMDDFDKRLAGLVAGLVENRTRHDRRADEARAWLMDNLDWTAAARPLTQWLERGTGTP